MSMPMTISPAAVQQNKVLHDTNKDYGGGGWTWAAYIEALKREDGHDTVLDFGCGKGVLARALKDMGVSIAEYDPAIPGKDRMPEPADLVVCTDVMEHVEPEFLDGFFDLLAGLTKRKLFFDICVAPALKTLPDGRNAHLTVQPPDWWRYRLSRRFDIVHWVERPEKSFVYGEAVPKGQGEAHAAAKAVRPKRRKMTPELSQLCDRIMQVSAATSDALSRIRSVRMFEGAGDEPADMQIVFDVLDDVADPAPVLEQVARLARKSVCLRLALTPERTEDWWRKLIEAHWRVSDWVPSADSLGVMASAKVSVGGIKVVGVVDPSERMEQVKRNIARIDARIEPSEPHGRRAILACYGPSLGDMIPRIKAEREECLCDVVSVSGAHDFLIEHGIVPNYHVECDPRAHKAVNLDKGHDAIRYLIGSVAHPDLFDKLEGCDVALWHVADSEHCGELVKLGEKGRHMITGGGSVGLRAISLFYAMGYRDFSIYGMDCSFADGGEKQWAGKHAGKRQEVLQAICAGQSYHTSPVLLSYATDFIEMIQKADGVFRVYGDGLLQRMCMLHASLAQRSPAMPG